MSSKARLKIYPSSQLNMDKTNSKLILYFLNPTSNVQSSIHPCTAANLFGMKSFHQGFAVLRLDIS